MQYLLVIVFLILLNSDPVGFSIGSGIYTYFVYHFYHVDFIHLILNSLGLISMWRILVKVIPWWKLLFLSYIYATVAAFVTPQLIPTIGASGMIYAMIGLFFASIIRNDMKIINLPQFLMFCSVVIIALVISLIGVRSNGQLHLASMILGVSYSLKKFTFRPNRGEPCVES